MAAPSQQPKHLYKILPSSANLPLPLPASSEYTLPSTPLDESDGYIHLSTSAQLGHVLSRFYKGDALRNVALVKLKHDSLSGKGGEQPPSRDTAAAQRELKWEEGGFPHLYGGALTGGDVVGVERLERGSAEGWEEVLRSLGERKWLDE